MRALYEIDEEITDCIDQETGEIVDVEKLNSLKIERDSKIENVILWRKDLLAEAEAVKGEAKKLNARAKALEHQADQLREWTAGALAGEKFKTSKCSVSYRNTKSVVIDDFALISQDYYKIPTEDWISKTLITDAIKAGKEVHGAHIEEKQSIIIK